MIEMQRKGIFKKCKSSRCVESAQDSAAGGECKLDKHFFFLLHRRLFPLVVVGWLLLGCLESSAVMQSIFSSFSLSLVFHVISTRLKFFCCCRRSPSSADRDQLE